MDGELNTQLPISLYVESGEILIGSSGADWENFNEYIASARLYDKSMSMEEVVKLMIATKPIK
jgi:hypothetical protein